MKIGIAADHAGLEQKGKLLELLKEKNFDIEDFGAYKYQGDDDYPDIVTPLAKALSEKKIDRAIAVCGSGVGVSIAANKFPGVRAALISETYSAHQGVEHDDMNMLCVGGRVLGTSLILEIILAFLNAEFQKDERFVRRLNKVLDIEKEYFKLN
ncbi:RpiB/LacA/LacB family sugar-phosphate isomerase [Zunongwangia atlantica]|uniref:RpiB/LacA/LacB family sugar-phosphate isomerase n=1 Tax=Zunongwangia atlantica 22II14-10F7 TaxID=1185767 RepID=A0A1Y1T730_9FLAO|nr:RpiB/LacA/LacB family sugar-phosphate isomerase [Zunongwangia atlantica]ORL46522.1 RpiB/LacA/LacB family sugar-phosphate isomerase [Zunongwangia atlantica 22II14-10F7]